MGFIEPSEVVVRQIGDAEWETECPLIYKGRIQEFRVPKYMKTDFASVPRVFVWFLPRYGRYTKAAIVHDYLWRVRAAAGMMRWRDADATFRRAMRELDVAFLRRWIMWAAVRWGALLKKGGYRGWWKDAPLVFFFTLVAAPVVLPPAVLILVSLVLFFSLELLVWAGLKIGSGVRVLIRKPSRKEVNAPSLLLKL